MDYDEFDYLLKQALRELLDCKNSDTLDLIYRILLEDKIEGRAD